MIIIYILAIIGGLCVLGMAFLALVIFLDCKRDTEKDAKEPEITCALTGELLVRAGVQTVHVLLIWI